MPPLPATRKFEIVKDALALAEERGFIPLAEAAGIIGVSADQLREFLLPILHLEFLDSQGVPIDQSGAFLLDEDDILQVDTGNWLRDVTAAAPSSTALLRLHIAASAYQATTNKVSPALDRVLEKLRQAVAIEMRLPSIRPDATGIAEDAYRQHRSLQFRYTKWKDDVATDREVLPYNVYGSWGHWYVQGPEVDDRVMKHWRIDGMQDATVGTIDFEPPIDLPERGWFDLSDQLRTVTVRVPASRLAALPRPRTIKSEEPEPDGRVCAEIEVAGDGQLDHLLVSLGPDGEIVEPVEYRQRRSDRARVLLEHLDAG